MIGRAIYIAFLGIMLGFALFFSVAGTATIISGG